MKVGSRQKNRRQNKKLQVMGFRLHILPTAFGYGQFGRALRAGLISAPRPHTHNPPLAGFLLQSLTQKLQVLLTQHTCNYLPL